MAPAKADSKDVQLGVMDDAKVVDRDASESSVVDDATLAIDTDPDHIMVLEDHTIMRRSAHWGDILYHSITAMVGAGVLGLPSTFAHLGWAGGIIFLAFSFWVSWHTYMLLVYMHEVPHLSSKHGIKRMDRYDQLAEYVWGKGRGKKILLPFQMAVLAGMGITYVLVGGEDLWQFSKLITPPGGAHLGKYVFIIMFGCLEVFLSMMPNLHDARLSSLLGAAMSVCYCAIAVGMSASVKPGPEVSYDPATVDRSQTDRLMGIFNAMTTVFFAYGGHNVALEIQATIGLSDSKPSSVKTMMKGVNWTFFVTGLCYFGVSILGFWAFGVGVSENVLMAFEHSAHKWVVAMANIMVVVHVAAAYQVYTQPLYQLFEVPMRRKWGDNIPLMLQFGVRVVYVGFTTLIALLIPFFGALMGLVGAVAITPTTFLFPPLMWVMYKKPKRWGLDWSANWSLVWITGILGVLGCVGSMYNIVAGWSKFKIFNA